MSSALRRIPASVQDWFFVAISLGHDRTVRLVLELDGRIDQPRLARALRLLLDAEPVLASRFQPRLFSAWWLPRTDLDDLELCRLVSTPEVERELHAFMALSIDPGTDPLVQVGVFRSATDTVCIKLSHAAMDGGAFKQLVQRLTALYRALGVDSSAVPPLDRACDRGQGQVLRLLPVRERLRAFLTQPFHKKTWSFPFTGRDSGDFTFSARTVGVSIPAIRDAVRRRGATITDALVTSFARALFATTDVRAGVPLPFTLAMDLRRYLPSPETAALCNLSSLAWIELFYRPGASIEDTLRDVHASLEKTMGDYPGVGLAMVMEIVSVLGYMGFRVSNRVRASLARSQGREFPSLSNIGVMDPAVMDFGDARVEQARFFGPVFFPPTFYVVSGSFEDTLYFSASYPRNVVPGNLVERHLDLMVSEISSLVSG
jgi:NRPS condensation-like uncharacterized protein